MPIYCRKCRKEVPDLLATETSTQCPSCGAPISFRDGIPRASARLLLKDGEETKGEFQVQAVVSIGKDKANYVQILHPTVALKHAEIRPTGGQYILVDLGSQSGTFLKEKRIKEAPLADGDEFRVGEIRFLFLNPPEALLPGQEFAITYTADKEDVENLAATVSAEKVGTKPDGGDLARAQEEIARFAKVFDIGRELTALTEPALVLETLMDGVFNNIKASRAAILLKHPSSGELYTPVARTAKGGKQRAHLSISRTVVKEALNRKEAVLIADTSSLHVGEEHTIRRQGIRSALCVPLMYKGAPMGCIYADSLDMTRMFNESDLRLVAGIAGMAAAAIVNARLMARVGQEAQLRKELESKSSGNSWAAGAQGLLVREVTVLVLRVCGAAGLLEGGHPERVSTLLQELLGILVDRLTPFEATVVGINGSSIVAVWGLAKASPGDAQAAVRGAMEVQSMFGQLNAARQKRQLRPIWMAYAVATGRVLAGQAQFRGRGETSLAGGALDVALTLANHAAQNQVLLAQSTYEKARDIVEVSALGALPAAKGEDAVTAYEAKALRG